MNNQSPEKQSDASILEVNKIFDTIQGEGPFSGHPATFIRLAGCNLQCTWCDTRYTKRTPMTFHDIAPKIHSKLVVITGGEPLRQNIVPLIGLLEKSGHMVQIETNGTIWRDGLDNTNAVIVISPKLDHIHPKLLRQKTNGNLVYIKMVVGENAYPSQPNNKGGDIPNTFKADYIIPLDSGNLKDNHKNNLMAIRRVIQDDSKLQVQIHKIVGLE